MSGKFYFHAFAMAAVSIIDVPVVVAEDANRVGVKHDSVGEHDYPMWGLTSARVNAPEGQGIPLDWDCGDEDWIDEELRYEGIRPKESRNIRWAVRLGSQTYGNPIVANGKVFVGTNNGAGYLKRYPPRIDLGVLLCFDEKNGDFLWQHSNPKLRTGRVHDWPLQGVCSTPIVQGDRLWYVSNRGEVVCLDTEGFYDDEDDGADHSTPRKWVSLFSLHATLRSELRTSRLVSERLRRAFSAAGETLPRWTYVRREPNQRNMSLGRRHRNPEGYIWRTDYELELVDGHVQVFSAKRASSQTPRFTISDLPLTQGLDQGVVNESLRESFAAFGVDLSADYQLTTQRPGVVWSLAERSDGVEQKFRLRLEQNQMLSAEMLLTPAHKHEADVVWSVDMIGQLGVSPHNMSNCSPLIVGNRLFVCTSNGLDESHINIPKPDAPSFLAMDKDTGGVLWSFTVPGKNILHAQWASPSYGVLYGQPQVIFPGGDGWVYSFDPAGDGSGGPKLLWKFDGNRKSSEWILGGRGTRNNIIAFPAIYDDLVYITMGQDPEHGDGEGQLWCIDPRRMDGGDVSAELAVDLKRNIIPHRRIQAVDPARGERAIANPDSAVIWTYTKFDQNMDGVIDFEEEFHRSLGIPAIRDDILYVSDFSGIFHCVDAKTGKVHWTHDMFSACWGSALVVDGKVYIGDEDGEISVFRHSTDPNIAMNDRREPINVIDMGNSVYMTPIVANNVLYIAPKNTLYAIAADEQ